MKKKPAKIHTRMPAFRPTQDHRKLVEFLAGAGIREDRMLDLIINTRTKKPIDAKTLRKYFRLELDGGHAKADYQVAHGLFKNATTATETYPGGIPLAQIFWLKTRARWRTVDKMVDEPTPPLTPEEVDERETARRLAFLLARGAASSGAKKKEPA